MAELLAGQLARAQHPLASPTPATANPDPKKAGGPSRRGPGSRGTLLLILGLAIPLCGLAVLVTILRFWHEGAAGSGADPIDRLSNRELQVLSLIGRGLSSREAAEALGLSVKTVETHRQSLKRKLNLATNAQLLQYAINWYASRSTPPAASAEPDPSGT